MGLRNIWLLLGTATFLLSGCENKMQSVTQLSSLCVQSKASQSVSHDIIGGSPVTEDTDWMVFIEAQDTRYIWTCGATLIHSRWALTAAHCVDGARSVSVTLGSLEYGDGEIVEVEESIMHEDYDDRTIENDIALLKLSREVDYPILGLIPESLLDDMFDDTSSYTVDLLGWGYTEVGTSNNRDLSSTLMTASTQLESYEDCNQYHRDEGYGTLPRSQLCFLASPGREDTGSCQGDSGGPAIMYYQGVPLQLGVTSWGNASCDPSEPSFYTNVISYLDWLEDETGVRFEQTKASVAEQGDCP